MSSQAGVQVIGDHPFLPATWTQQRGQRVIDDVNPAAAVYSRKQAKLLSDGSIGSINNLDGNAPGGPGGPGGNGGGSGPTSGDFNNLRQLVCQILAALNGASANCDPDTSQVSITFPGLPSTCP